MLSEPLIFKHSDTKWDWKNTVDQTLGGGHAPVAPPSKSATACSMLLLAKRIKREARSYQELFAVLVECYINGVGRRVMMGPEGGLLVRSVPHHKVHDGVGLVGRQNIAQLTLNKILQNNAICTKVLLIHIHHNVCHLPWDLDQHCRKESTLLIFHLPSKSFSF